MGNYIDVVNDVTTVNSHISDVLSILKISFPKLETHKVMFWQGNNLAAIDTNNHSDLPVGYEYLGGYFEPNNNTIYLSENYDHKDYKLLKESLVPRTDAEILYGLIHELRHVWQYTYERNKYYSQNAFGLSVVNDPSEIDADAFAIAYVFSDKTQYTAKDFPNMTNEINLQGTLDNGKRWNTATKYSVMYQFNSNNKIVDLQNAADKELIEDIAKFFKSNGMI